MTASQYRAANQLLMKQNREMSKKAAAASSRAVTTKDKKELRREMIENARGKVMNYALKQNEHESGDEDGQNMMMTYQYEDDHKNADLGPLI